jgi:hypothetical protein
MTTVHTTPDGTTLVVARAHQRRYSATSPCWGRPRPDRPVRGGGRPARARRSPRARRRGQLRATPSSRNGTTNVVCHCHQDLIGAFYDLARGRYPEGPRAGARGGRRDR